MELSTRVHVILGGLDMTVIQTSMSAHLTRVYMEAVVDSADPLNISSEELRIDVTKAVVRIKT